MTDALNDTLKDRRLVNLFKGVTPDKLVEVIDTRIDGKLSHVIAIWTSRRLQSMVQRDRTLESTAEKIVQEMSRALNAHEGMVRTALAARVEFKVRSNTRPGSYCEHNFAACTAGRVQSQPCYALFGQVRTFRFGDCVEIGARWLREAQEAS
jgi:hypothetical protein